MDNLDKLIEAIEAGDGPGNHALTLDTLDQVKWCVDAWRGSLDAALRLHEALLPGWGWMMGNKGTVTAIPPEAMFAEHGVIGPTCRVSDSPARAWLLAILRAVKAQQSPGGGA